ncbi:hypothetical protein ISN44_As11g028680 [Arabidopsis suecica]|uniref:Uncharacterized protein n=1 Tax=Arabidopsis suecica TaxID=45249 RepID=A0A8T1ZFI0_ARASU|nr:hypothetical protein ISN44_As11g028680 [Arabidopsis suecica]
MSKAKKTRDSNAFKRQKESHVDKEASNLQGGPHNDMIKHEQGAEEELENELDHTPFNSIELGTTHRINLEKELELGPDEALIIQTSLMTWSRANKMIFEVGERLMCSIQIKENPPDALPERRSIPKVSAYVPKNAFNPDHTDMIRLSLSKEPNAGFKAALEHMRSTKRREEDNRFKPPDLDQDQHQDISCFILINEGPPNEILKSKLKPTMHRPFNAFRIIQNQDYTIDLQGKHNLSSSFEISDLVLSNAEKSDLRSNPFQVGEDDVILESSKDMECRNELEPVEQHEARNQLEPEEQHEPEDELVAADVLWKKLIKPPWIGERAMSIEFNNGRVTQLYSFSLVEFCPNGFSQQGKMVGTDGETNSNNNKLLMEAVTKLMDTKLNAFCAELHQMSRSPRRSQEKREQIPHPKDGKPRRPDEKPNWRRRSANQDYYRYDDQRRFEKQIQQQNDVKGVKAVKQSQKKSPASRQHFVTKERSDHHKQSLPPKEQKENAKSHSMGEEQFKEELLEILNAYNKPNKAKCALPSNSKDAKFAFLSESVKDICVLSEKADLVLENDQACDKLILSKPVQPSSIVSVSQVLEEESPEETKKSLPLAKDMEQLPDFVPEPVLMPIPSYYSRKHCKDIELVRIEPNLFVLVSAEEEKRFGLERVKEFRVSDSVLRSMLTSLGSLKPETLLKMQGLVTNEQHEIVSSLNVSKFSNITELIRARTEPMLHKTFTKSRNHLESESNVLDCKNVFKHHHKELFDSSRTFDVFSLVFVKAHEKQVKDATSNTRRSYDFTNPFDYGSKEYLDPPWSKMKESKESEARTHLFGVWNWKYLRKTTAIAKGCSTLKYYFANVYFCSILFFVSTLFPFDVGDLDLRSNPFQAEGDDMIKHEQGAEEELENELDHTPFNSIELGTTHRINLEKELELGPDEALIIQTSLMTWSRANKMIFEVGERLLCSIQIKENPPDALPERRSIPKVSAYVPKNAFNLDHTDMIRLSLSKEPNAGFKAALEHMRSTERREEDNRFKPPDLDQDQHQDISSFILINEGPPNEIFKSKLKPTMHRPFNAFRIIQNQDYTIDLQGKHNLSSSFEISDLVLSNAEKSDLRSNPFQVGEDDVILESSKDMECRNELEPVEQHEARNQLEPEEQHEPEDELVAADVLLKKLIKPPWIGERAMSIEFNNGRVTQLYSFSLVEFCPNGFSQQEKVQSVYQRLSASSVRPLDPPVHHSTYSSIPLE